VEALLLVLGVVAVVALLMGAAVALVLLTAGEVGADLRPVALETRVIRVTATSPTLTQDTLQVASRVTDLNKRP
jgi:hypothetical protein